MLTHLKTALLVTLVTILIWVFAEAESLTRKNVRVEVLLDPEPDGNRLVDVVDGQGWQKRADVVFEGSTAAVTEAEAVGRRPIRLLPGMEGFPSDPGEQTVDLFAALRELPELRNKGVSIVRVDPPNVRVRVDQLVSREVKVIAVVPGSELDGQPEIKPGTVTLRLPAGEAEALTPTSAVRARVSPESVTKLVPGRHETVSNVVLELPIELQHSRRIRIEPSRADVSLTLRSRAATWTLPNVPVSLVLAAGEYARWEIIIPDEDRFITDVKVTGPVDLIDQIKRSDVTVAAQVLLSFEELERGITSKDVSFSSIPAAADLQFTADNTKVRLKINRRQPPPEPANGTRPPKPAGS